MTASDAPPAAKRIYDVFLLDIESGFCSGRIKTGDQLPGERILAETYGISRASVCEKASAPTRVLHTDVDQKRSAEDPPAPIETGRRPRKHRTA
ncbi:hypothetical protein ACIPVK_18655 [Paeniglutamicibacter sp. MACA_103]|uniref:hypothetical protein n=1 Tax=Paeniglutamicibacter sp. MACA_103 TaxID=3377337 RepID=UPI0038956A18